MDFSQIKNLIIPEGNVKEIRIGGVTVWKKSKPVTISYVAMTSGSNTWKPADKVVESGHVLTAEDLPSDWDTTFSSESNSVHVTSDGWYIGDTKATPGMVITEDTVLCLQAKIVTTITKGNIYKTNKQTSTGTSSSVSVSVPDIGAGTAANKTITISKTASSSNYSSSGAFAGKISNMTITNPCTASWSVSHGTITWKAGTTTMAITKDQNAYPSMIVRNSGRTSIGKHVKQNSTGTLSITIDQATLDKGTNVLQLGYGYYNSGNKVSYGTTDLATSANPATATFGTSSIPSTWTETYYLRAII